MDMLDVYYVINADGRFYSYDYDGIQKFMNDFTDRIEYAHQFESLDDANEFINNAKYYEFDGNTPITKDWLSICKLEVVPV